MLLLREISQIGFHVIGISTVELAAVFPLDSKKSTHTYMYMYVLVLFWTCVFVNGEPINLDVLDVFTDVKATIILDVNGNPRRQSVLFCAFRRYLANTWGLIARKGLQVSLLHKQSC